MATRIRLKRIGSKKQPYYRIVVADQRNPRSGRSIEELGTYGPVTDPPLLQIKTERALHWLLEGAQPSDTAKSLLSKVGVMAAFAEAHKQRKAKLAEEKAEGSA
ncbi:MAG: 30S ribosomal protein S16 [Armatimonadota bacterium]